MVPRLPGQTGSPATSPRRVLLGPTSEDVDFLSLQTSEVTTPSSTRSQGPLGPCAPDPSNHRGSVGEHTELIDFDRSTNTTHLGARAGARDRSPSPRRTKRNGCEVPTF